MEEVRNEQKGEYFYPRPPRGGRRIFVSAVPIALLFLSTPSARRATYKTALKLRKVEFLSTPSARRATQFDCLGGVNHLISIHALREEGDTSAAENLAVAGVFLSTPSARRATRVRNQPHRRKDNFYPRPPRGGRHCRDCQRNHTWRFLSTPSARRATPQLRRPTAHRAISIHALREEGDPGCHDHCERYAEFLSTPSARRATTAMLGHME